MIGIIPRIRFLGVERANSLAAAVLKKILLVAHAVKELPLGNCNSGSRDWLAWLDNTNNTNNGEASCHAQKTIGHACTIRCNDKIVDSVFQRVFLFRGSCTCSCIAFGYPNG
jgi:hypothetical protein